MVYLALVASLQLHLPPSHVPSGAVLDLLRSSVIVGVLLLVVPALSQRDLGDPVVLDLASLGQRLRSALDRLEVDAGQRSGNIGLSVSC